MTKAELRKIYLAKRNALSESEYVQFNEQLCEQFFSTTDLSPIRTLHIFLPITSKREPNTWLIIERLQSEFKNIQLVIPKVSGTELKHIVYENADQLKTNKWGIQEPEFGVEVTPGDIDVVIVPLVVTDIFGNRVGYGKGFYDRFLSHCHADCKKIGLSFFKPIEKIETKREDVSLDFCLTPKQLCKF